MSALHLKEYLDILNGENLNLDQCLAIGALIDLAGKLYSQSDFTSPLRRCEKESMELLKKLTGLDNFQAEEFIKKYSDQAHEQIADAYSAGFRAAIEEVCGFVHLWI